MECSYGDLDFEVDGGPVKPEEDCDQVVRFSNDLTVPINGV